MTGMEFKRRDRHVITDLTANTYGYGGGGHDHGVQVTLRRDVPPAYPEPMLTLRLPRPDALALARWIIRSYGASAPADLRAKL